MKDIIQKTRDDYNKIAKHFAVTRAKLWPDLEEFRPFLANGQRILDWGCGSGRLLLLLEPYNISYIGIDQSLQLLKIAKKTFAKEIKSKKASFYCTAHKDKKFPDQHFDLVFMIASFFHLPDTKSRLRLLAKAHRELKADGRLLMTLWNLGSDWAQKKKKDWKQLGENDFLIPWKNPEGKVEAERYYHHFTKEEILSLLTDSGFVAEKIGYFKGTWNDTKGGQNLIVIASKAK